MIVAKLIIVGMPTMPLMMPNTTASVNSRALVAKAVAWSCFCAAVSSDARASAGLGACCSSGCAADMLMRARADDRARPASTSGDISCWRASGEWRPCSKAPRTSAPAHRAFLAFLYRVEA